LIPCTLPNITLALDKPTYSPGDSVRLSILNNDLNNMTFATIRVLDMSAYLELDHRKKGEVSRVTQVMLENEIWQKYGTKGELWYATQYIDWIYSG
jgi:hypothetical protein